MYSVDSYATYKKKSAPLEERPSGAEMISSKSVSC